MKIAVTAASGGLATATMKHLINEIGTENLCAVARSPEKVKIPRIETRHGDYQTIKELTKAFSGIDTVVMISAPVGDWDRVTMHQNVITAAKLADVRKLLYTSIIGNGKEKDTWFWQTQQVNRQAEIDLQESGLQWIVARNGLYLEKDLHHIVQAKDIGVYKNIAGNGKTGYITVDELAYATAKLAISDSSNGQILNLVGDTLTQAQLVNLTNQVFGIDIRYESITDEENIAELMKDPNISVRGEKVAKMLAGCFQAVRAGAFDVKSDYKRAAGRAVKPTLQMIQEQRDAMRG